MENIQMAYWHHHLCLLFVWEHIQTGIQRIGFFQFCLKTLTTVVRIKHKPKYQATLPRWQTKCFYNTQPKASDHIYYVTGSPPGHTVSTRLHWVTPSCWVSSCFKEGQGRGYANHSHNHSSVRSKVCQICMLRSVLFILMVELISISLRDCCMLLLNIHVTLWQWPLAPPLANWINRWTRDSIWRGSPMTPE